MQSRKLKVLYIDTGFAGNWGGSKSLINMVNSVKYEIEPILIFTSKGIEEEILIKNNCKYICLSIGSIKHSFSVRPLKKVFSYLFKAFGSMINNIIAIYKIYNLIKTEKIDIVHSNTSVFCAGLIAAKLSGTKHVWHLREFLFKGQNLYPIFGFIGLRKLISKSDTVICTTKAIKDFYKCDKATVIYDAIISEDCLIEEKPEKEDYLFYCGALSSGKRVEDAIKAFTEIASEYETLRLKIAGTGQTEKKLKIMAQKSGYNDRIEFLGYVKNPLPIYAKAKAFLMTSVSEGLGRVTVEAMLSNCIAIGFNTEGTSEMIDHNKTGYLYNNFEELVDYIKVTLNSLDNCKDMRINAKHWALENCTEKAFGKKLLEVYRKIKV